MRWRNKMDPTPEITRYSKYFREQLELIGGIKASGSTKIFKKSLYVSAIDALSKCVFPHRTGNRDRIVALLVRFSNWPEGDRVSLPHLARLLRLNPDPAYDKLRKTIFKAYDNSPVLHSEVVGIDTDPTYETIKKDWPVEKETRIPIEGVPLEHLR